MEYNQKIKEAHSIVINTGKSYHSKDYPELFKQFKPPIDSLCYIWQTLSNQFIENNNLYLQITEVQINTNDENRYFVKNDDVFSHQEYYLNSGIDTYFSNLIINNLYSGELKLNDFGTINIITNATYIVHSTNKIHSFTPCGVKCVKLQYSIEQIFCSNGETQYIIRKHDNDIIDDGGIIEKECYEKCDRIIDYDQIKFVLIKE